MYTNTPSVDAILKKVLDHVGVENFKPMSTLSHWRKYATMTFQPFADELLSPSPLHQDFQQRLSAAQVRVLFSHYFRSYNWIVFSNVPLIHRCSLRVYVFLFAKLREH